MAPKRATRASAATKSEQVDAGNTLPQLITNENEQRRMFILPRNLSPEARIITLSGPATSCKNRYLFCPNQGLFEFTKIAAPLNYPRSCLVTSEHGFKESKPSSDNIAPDCGLQKGYVLENPDLLLATPMDPVFFFCPIFESASKGTKGSFRLEDDYIDILTEKSAEMAQALYLPSFRARLVQRLRAVSSVQEFGEDVLLKPDQLLLAKLILEKGRKMIVDGVWPSSMEEVFVRKQLEIPAALVLESNPQLPTPEQSMTSSDLDSQTSEVVSDQQLPESSDSTSPTTSDQSASAASLKIKKLMRLRIALRYITASYLSKDVQSRVLSTIESNNLIHFTILDEHLQKVNDAHTELQARRALIDNVSRKRSAMEDDEAAEARAEKRRKKEEEEKRKKAESRAVKELKKVDTSGMKKLSSFFTKSTATATAKSK